MSSSCGQTAAGGSSHAALSTAHTEHTVVARLPTGERRYWLKVEQWMFDSWNADEAFKGFCYFLNDYAGQAALNSGFENIPVLTCGHKPISHALLACDGYVLGNFVQCGKVEEVVDSSRYAIFEVPPLAQRAPRVAHLTGVAEAVRARRPPYMWRICGDFVPQLPANTRPSSA
jgi:hypothetical protein